MLEAMPDTSTVVVDVSAVESIDSHGLRALVGAAHRLAEEERLMAVHGAPPAVRAVLRSAGLHHWAALT
jgi:anti-anti-sigma factor